MHACSQFFPHPIYCCTISLLIPQVQIYYPLTGIRVTVNKKGNVTVVQSITLLSSYANFGPYGSSGEGESYTATGTNIVGFFGRSAELINALGIYIES